jgi:hypothetical protein
MVVGKIVCALKWRESKPKHTLCLPPEYESDALTEAKRFIQSDGRSVPTLVSGTAHSVKLLATDSQKRLKGQGPNHHCVKI